MTSKTLRLWECALLLAFSLTLGGKEVTLGAIAKGSGMIHPNMGTMLCFLTTDCAISPEMIRAALLETVQVSFNRISVDGDTSTNDTCCVLANGLAGNPVITEKGPDYDAFVEALRALCVELAKKMASDGEGATHLITCTVTGAGSEQSAETVAKSVIGSALTKAAIFGADANWGRVLCAMGIPMGLQYSITAIGSVILQTAVNTLGSTYVAAVSAGVKLFQLLGCPFDAMGATMATYCGQNVGACKLDRLGQGMRACAWLGLGYAVLAVGAMLLFAPQCAMLFLNQDEADLARLVSLTSQYITTLTAFFFPLALVNIVRFSIQGMGFSQLAILAGVLEMAARTVMGQVFVPLFGFTAACFASPVAWISADLFLIPAAILCIRHLRKLYPDQTEEAALRPVRAEGP